MKCRLPINMRDARALILSSLFLFQAVACLKAPRDNPFDNPFLLYQAFLQHKTFADFNGDGISDLVVSAYLADANGLADNGAAYVFFGQASWCASMPCTLSAGGASAIIRGTAANEWLGIAVQPAGDLNGDGIADFIVGATNVTSAAPGRVYVFFGSRDLVGEKTPADANVIVSGEGLADSFGQAVAPLGDVNGDGIDDFIVGAYQADVGGLKCGEAYVFFGSRALAGTLTRSNASLRIKDNCATVGNFSRSLAAAGDVNGDGIADVLIGADTAEGTGSAFIYFGSALPSDWSAGCVSFPCSANSSEADLIFKGLKDTGGGSDRLGFSVDGAGDVNGDGIGDLILGSLQADAVGSTAMEGRGHLFFGSSRPSDWKSSCASFPCTMLSSDADVSFLGATAQDYLGVSVAGIGDVNNDGTGDLVIGASGASPTLNGDALVLLGSSKASDWRGDCASFPCQDLTQANADFLIKGSAAADSMGAMTRRAGDLNGDGMPDIIVVALAADVAGIDSGELCIFFGTSSLSGTRSCADADVRIQGAAAGDKFGRLR